MSRQYRCKLLYLAETGILREVPLRQGGGMRECDWESPLITFDDVHQKLLSMYKLNKQRARTSLYDFALHPLKIHQYNTFLDYVNKHSFPSHSIVVHLCYHENELSVPPQPANPSGPTPPPPVDPTSPVPLQTSEEDPVPSAADISFDAMETEPPDLRTIFHTYPYRDTIERLVDEFSSLLQKINYETVLLKMFENICRISSFIDIYDEFTFTALADQCRSTTDLLASNNPTFGHLADYLMIKNKFIQFDFHCQRLNQEQNNQQTVARFEATPSNCSFSQLVTYLIRLVGLFQEYQIPYYEINSTLIEKLQDQQTTTDPKLIGHVRELIISVRRKFIEKYAKRHLYRWVFETVSELFESILVNLEHLSSR